MRISAFIFGKEAVNTYLEMYSVYDYNYLSFISTSICFAMWFDKMKNLTFCFVFLLRSYKNSISAVPIQPK